MTENYYIGRYEEDGLHGVNHGWIVGTFMGNPVRRSNAVEIKYWEFPIGKPNHPTKTSTIIEVTFVLKGEISGHINGQHITLSAGNYVIIQPNTVNNLLEKVGQEAAGLTVKAPSDPEAKKVLTSLTS